MDNYRKAIQVVGGIKMHQRLWNLTAGKGSVGRYGFIGVTGVAVDLTIFAVLIGAGMFPVIATTFSTLVGITNNYTLNSLLNFRVALSSKRGMKFLAVGSIGLASSAGLMQLFMSAELDSFAAKWLSVPIVVSGQFLANKLWTFK